MDMDPRQRWLSHFKDEEEKTKCSGALERFEGCTGVKAEVLLETTRAQMLSGWPRDAEDALQKYYNDMIKDGLSPNSAGRWIYVIRSFFKHNGRPLPPFPLVKKGPVGHAWRRAGSLVFLKRPCLRAKERGDRLEHCGVYDRWSSTSLAVEARSGILFRLSLQSLSSTCRANRICCSSVSADVSPLLA